MNTGNKGLGLGEAASQFLAGLPAEARKVSQPEVYKFVRWYSWERPLAGLTAPEVANYAERLSSSDIDYDRKLELIRAFLAYARKEGWTRSNLATHLKAKKSKTRSSTVARHGVPQAISMTEEGYTELQTELATLKGKRSEVIDEVRRAAADKDFRENAPFHAAREKYGQLAGRIRGLEEDVKSAVVLDEQRQLTIRVSVGDSVLLQDLDCGEELRYTIVSPREVDPVRGKISSASPVGKAIVGREQGEMIEVSIPAGKLHYQIKLVER